VLLDAPISLYYGEIEPALVAVPGDFGEVRYAIAIPLGADELGRRSTMCSAARGRRSPARSTSGGDCGTRHRGAARRSASRESRCRRGPRGCAPRSKTAAVPRTSAERYPNTIRLFARGALITLALSLVAMALAVPLGVMLALARRTAPLRWIATGYIEFVRGRRSW
jgi:polar amino acid transport system substrate-binding protein